MCSINFRWWQLREEFADSSVLACVWSAAHTAGCLLVLRTFGWFSTITHPRCFLTNELYAGYYNHPGMTCPATVEAARSPESTDVLWLAPRRGAWAADNSTIKPPSESRSHTWCWAPASTGLCQGFDQKSNLLQSAFSSVPFAESRRWGQGETVASLTSGASSSTFETPRGTCCICVDRSFFPVGMSSGPQGPEHGGGLWKGWSEGKSVAVSPHVKPSSERSDRKRGRSLECASPPRIPPHLLEHCQPRLGCCEAGIQHGGWEKSQVRWTEQHGQGGQRRAWRTP